MADFHKCSLAHQLLPESERTKPEEVSMRRLCPVLVLTLRQDVPYISPIIQEIEAEMKERADLEAMKIERK